VYGGPFFALACGSGRARQPSSRGAFPLVSRFAARRSLRLFCAGFFIGFFGLS